MIETHLPPQSVFSLRRTAHSETSFPHTPDPLSPVPYSCPEKHCPRRPQQGYIKRTPLAAFKSTSSRGLIVIGLGEDDTLRWVKR